MKNLKSYVAAIVATASIAGFSAFNVADASNNLAETTLYFHGDPANAAEVADESNWNDTPNGESCDDVNQNACSMEVDQTDLTSSGQLDPAKIQLDATQTSDGYIAERSGGNSGTIPTFTNRSSN